MVSKPLPIGRRIATRFYGAIGLTSCITLITIVVAWVTFGRVHDTQQSVFETTLPETEFVVDLARTSGALASVTPRLTAAISLEEFDDARAVVAELRQEFEAKLGSVFNMEVGEASESLAANGNQLLDNVEQIETSMNRLFEIRGQADQARFQLGKLELEIRRNLIPLIDDQFFYAMTGRKEYGNLPAPRAEHFSEGEIHLYRYLSDIEKQGNIAIQLLATSAITTDVALIGVLTEQYNSAWDRIQVNIKAIERPQLVQQVTPLLNELLELGSGDQSIFAIRESELRLLDAQRDLIAEGQGLSDDLIGNAQDLVRLVNSSAFLQAEEAARELDTARLVLIGLGVSGILAAIAISWLLVGRVLLRRLRYMSVRMSTMAEGMLEDEVVVSGHDEIAEMASALEVFRKKAMEAQRLNIVEMLAAELREKNDAMQEVVDELKAAQRQIVMREKLAALGELTAGVAHEIKNPLNFVKNFSESSKELVVELGEIAEDESLSKEERADEMKSISEMLIGNCDRIIEHGNRAVRIVNDMLRMGRDSGSAQETDINQLVEQNAKLAFHGTRAAIEDFQVKLEFSLDPEVGIATVVSQEIGRVILNLVGNSCHATHEKRIQRLEKAGGEGPISYRPRIDISTKRLGDSIQMTFRDNGSGISESHLDKIFNPFFTTKPTDQGTGLGLAMSSDIVQKHGGSISARSSVGEYTEMTVVIRVDASESPTTTVKEDETAS